MSGKENSNKTSYHEWINTNQTKMYKDWKFNVTFSEAEDTENPPRFDQHTMFYDGVEEYAMSMTSLPSENIQNIAKATKENKMFAPCMVGTLESQFLKMQVSLSNAKTVLDVGTFTGMSAMSMAEGLPSDGKVVTLEFEDKIADVAEASFRKSNVGHKINLMRGSAIESMKKLLNAREKFDVIFIDADKENYITYYNMSMAGLLADNGFIMADNSMSSLLYDQKEFRAQKLHEFNQHVKNDPRVEQVVCTIREGVSIIKRKS